MSNLINKAKDALTGNHHENPNSYNAGPHNHNVSNTMDPRVDSDFDHRNDPTSHVGGRGNTQTAGYGAGTGYGGTHTGHGTAPTSTTGNTMHSSHLANKADPRVDSDFDHRANPTSAVGGYDTTQTTSGYGGQHGHGTAPTTATGNTMHSSNLANKIDPRVDSDRDHRANPASNVGGYGNSQTSAGYGPGPGATSATGTGSAMHSSHNPAVGAGGYGTSQTSGYGQPGHVAAGTGHHPTSGAGGYGAPQTAGYGHQEYGAGGIHDTVTTGGAGYGGHNTGVPANTGYTGTTTSAGHAGTSTHPPHSSDLLNKVDPRVKVDKEGRPL